MAVTMADITHLRKMSGAGMMDCKKALEEANNDFDKAMEIIRKKGQAVAAKRSDREASEGCVLATENGDFAAVVALKCETDFVAKNADFVALTQDILNAVMSNKPATKEELLKMALSDGRSIENHITDRVGVTGEKMELGEYEYVKGASTVSYIHPGNKLAAIVAFNQELDHQVAREIAMQVAAMNPVAVPMYPSTCWIRRSRLPATKPSKQENRKTCWIVLLKVLCRSSTKRTPCCNKNT